MHFLQNLRTILEKELPGLSVDVAVYPKYETQGDLSNAVVDFREWFSAPHHYPSIEKCSYTYNRLHAKVINREKASVTTPSPVLDPTIGVVLVAHSMGYVHHLIFPSHLTLA
jgi:hypothetical protein